MGRGKSSGGGVRSKRLDDATGITGVAASLPEGFVKVERVCVRYALDYNVSNRDPCRCSAK